MRTPAFFAALLILAACQPSPPTVALYAEGSIPERLSEWGLLAAHGNDLVLGDGVIPYELNTPLFSDYALKLRTIWMPDSTSAAYRSEGVFEFPVGTIISKTFHYQRLDDTDVAEMRFVRVERDVQLDGRNRLDLNRHTLLETRLLVRYESGWKAMPYVWNRQQTDAWLEITGDIIPATLAGSEADLEFPYVVPDQNQCGGCHTPDHSSGELQPLGPRAWQLNRSFDSGHAQASQLQHWKAAGLLNGLPDRLPDGVAWGNRHAYSIDQQARAYLDSNCAHCHNERGAADTSGLHLNVEAPYDRNLGVCKPPVAVGRGSGDRPYDIVPGNPEQSIMLFRMQESDPAIAMPELGRSTVHAEAVLLIETWIESLSGDC